VAVLPADRSVRPDIGSHTHFEAGVWPAGGASAGVTFHFHGAHMVLCEGTLEMKTVGIPVNALQHDARRGSSRVGGKSSSALQHRIATPAKFVTVHTVLQIRRIRRSLGSGSASN